MHLSLFDKTINHIFYVLQKRKKHVLHCRPNKERLENNSEKVETVSHCYVEINATVLNLQKKIDSRLDTTKSSIQTLEASISSARSSMDQLSHDCATEFKNLESKNDQVHEALSKISTDIKKKWPEFRRGREITNFIIRE